MKTGKKKENKEIEYLIEYITTSISQDVYDVREEPSAYLNGYLDAKMNMLTLIRPLLHNEFETYEDYGKFLLDHTDEMQAEVDRLKEYLLTHEEEDCGS